MILTRSRSSYRGRWRLSVLGIASPLSGSGSSRNHDRCNVELLSEVCTNVNIEGR